MYKTLFIRVISSFTLFFAFLEQHIKFPIFNKCYMISILRLENELNINLNIFKNFENLINFFKY